MLVRLLALLFVFVGFYAHSEEEQSDLVAAVATLEAEPAPKRIRLDLWGTTTTSPFSNPRGGPADATGASGGI